MCYRASFSEKFFQRTRAAGHASRYLEFVEALSIKGQVGAAEFCSHLLKIYSTSNWVREMC